MDTGLTVGGVLGCLWALDAFGWTPPYLPLMRSLRSISPAPPARTQAMINQGRGFNGTSGCLTRDTESGQLLIDRGLHLDVLEYLLWINR